MSLEFVFLGQMSLQQMSLQQMSLQLFYYYYKNVFRIMWVEQSYYNECK